MTISPHCDYLLDVIVFRSCWAWYRIDFLEEFEYGLIADLWPYAPLTTNLRSWSSLVHFDFQKKNEKYHFSIQHAIYQNVTEVVAN